MLSFLRDDAGYDWHKVVTFFCVWVLIIRAAFGMTLDPTMITLITVLQGFKFGKAYINSKNGGNGNGNGNSEETTK